jgi:tetratricopeptide (TPR) repeat protein
MKPAFGMSPRTRLYIVGAIALLFISAAATALYCIISYFQGKSLYARGYQEMVSGHYETAIALYEATTHKMLDSTTRALVYGNRGWCYTKQQKDDQAIRDFTESIRLDPRPLYSVFDRGLAYLRKSEFEKARADLTTALEKDPNLTEAYFNRAWISMFRGEWEGAIADFSEAIRCEARESQYYVDRGMAYAATHQFDAAIANFDAALALYPTHPGAYIQRAEAYRRKGDSVKGLADVTEAIRKMPNVPRLFYARAYIYLERGAVDEAIVDCNAALRLDPNYDLAYLARSRGFGQKHDWEKCLDDAEAGLKITPNSAWGHYLRGRALSARGEINEAISEFDQTLALNPADTWAIVSRAENYAYRREYSKAHDDLRQAVERFPGAAAPHLGLAWFLATCPNDAYRDGSQAISEAIKACELLDWNEWYALDVLAAAYAEHDEFDEAIRYANEALGLPNASPQERFFVEQRLAGYNYRIAARDLPPSSVGHGPLEEAISAYANKNYDRAIGRLNLILPPNPGASITAAWFRFFDGTYGERGFVPTALSDRRDRANAFYYRALAYQKKREWDNAIADFSTALHLEPESAACLRERGFAYLRKNAFEQALRDLEETIRRQPDDALAYNYRAETFSALRQWETALAEANTAIRIDPKLAQAYFTRGWIYHARKEFDSAIADFEKADWLEPNRLGTLQAKARMLAAKGYYKSAAREFRELSVHFHDSARARNAWAWFLATCPDGSLRHGITAVFEAKAACELSDWAEPSYLDTLAAAYAENGEFDQAVKFAARAVEKLPLSDSAHPRFEQHLAFFQQKKAWRTNSDDE